MSAESSLVAPRQVTSAPHGHILTNTAVWSPDGQWIVYDVRSDPAGTVFDGTRIERVHVASGRVEVLYESRHGACCGVATYHPAQEKVVFILGPEYPTPDWHYSTCHRRGVIVATADPGTLINLDARDLIPPFTAGALRGGSHVHVFSPDGKYVAFTYEDHVLSQSPSPVPRGGARGGAIALGADHNQRNVGVSLVGQRVTVPRSHVRNHDGDSFSVLATETVNYPTPGSDEINRAYEDAWIGTHGYVGPNGHRQTHALAFLGDVVTENGNVVTELFVVDLPIDITIADDEPLQGTTTRRPAPACGTTQRRITFTTDRKHPGIQGPRHWPRSSRDGSWIAFYMRDDDGHVQLWTISPNGTELVQITSFPFSVASAFSWHPQGTHIALIADGSVWLVDTSTHDQRRLTVATAANCLPRSEACVFSPEGAQIAYVQPVDRDGATCNQIFVVDSGL